MKDEVIRWASIVVQATKGESDFSAGQELQLKGCSGEGAFDLNVAVIDRASSDFLWLRAEARNYPEKETL